MDLVSIISNLCRSKSDPYIWSYVRKTEKAAPGAHTGEPLCMMSPTIGPGGALSPPERMCQNSALPTVRGCSSTSRMLETPVRYITIRSKPRPNPAWRQEP